jgi:GNAT superfamily N-acetyltransferase
MITTCLLERAGRGVMHMVKALPAYLDGEVRLFNFAEDGIDHHSLEWFFAIQGELMEEWSENERNGCADKGFIHNQISILEAFVKGNLYGLCMPETQSMRDHSRDVTPDDPHFMKVVFGAQYRFPVFCVVKNNRIKLLWVAARMRRRGLGTRLVDLLKKHGVSGADRVLEDALPFWQRLGTVIQIPLGPSRVAFG